MTFIRLAFAEQSFDSFTALLGHLYIGGPFMASLSYFLGYTVSKHVCMDPTPQILSTLEEAVSVQSKALTESLELRDELIQQVRPKPFIHPSFRKRSCFLPFALIW